MSQQDQMPTRSSRHPYKIDMYCECCKRKFSEGDIAEAIKKQAHLRCDCSDQSKNTLSGEQISTLLQLAHRDAEQRPRTPAAVGMDDTRAFWRASITE